RGGSSSRESRRRVAAPRRDSSRLSCGAPRCPSGDAGTPPTTGARRSRTGRRGIPRGSRAARPTSAGRTSPSRARPRRRGAPRGRERRRTRGKTSRRELPAQDLLGELSGQAARAVGQRAGDLRGLLPDLARAARDLLRRPALRLLEAAIEGRETLGAKLLARAECLPTRGGQLLVVRRHRRLERLEARRVGRLGLALVALTRVEDRDQRL